MNQEILKSKAHYDILDGMRGVAAIAVVIFHFMEWVFTDSSKNFIAHGFLAVDFFFCLSGFVIGYAYDDRIKTLGVVQFFKSRLIRLHPLVIIGTVMGLLALLFDPFSSPTHSIAQFILFFTASVFLIPLPLMEDRSYNLFGLNAPSWSLFWEYVANIFYIFILCKLNKRTLSLLVMLAAFTLGYVSYNAGNLLGGWSKDNFLDGGARIAYSFTAGLLIYRFNYVIKNKLGFIGLAILLCSAFIMPWTKWNWITELLVVLFYFPLLIALGAGSSLSSAMKKVCQFLGNISYPLYMTHYAALWLFGHYYTLYNPNVLQLTYVTSLSVILLVVVAYITMLFYDIPVRKYLTLKR